ncbi:hypothetical protein ACH5RR_026218 [Cinchona calisaya]|uniref:Uncharacterized protein n=1 Tax=Cinchona calisaya TaxID=153742 RepID=A0ABD2Z1Y3_9GENT
MPEIPESPSVQSLQPDPTSGKDAKFANFDNHNEDTAGEDVDWGTSADEEEDKNGVAIKSLNSVIKVMSIELWWSFRSRVSIWSTFLSSRYLIRTVHPSFARASQTSSPSWKRLCAIMEVAEHQIYVLPKWGNSSFWYDNWDGAGIFHQPERVTSDIKLKEAWNGTCWNINAIKNCNPNFAHRWLYGKRLVLAEGKDAQFANFDDCNENTMVKLMIEARVQMKKRIILMKTLIQLKCMLQNSELYQSSQHQMSLWQEFVMIKQKFLSIKN